MFRAAFTEANVTPVNGLQMGLIPGEHRATEEVHLPLFGRVAVFDDGKQQAAVICMDIGWVMHTTVADWRKAISEQTNVAPGNILISCSHTHRAPCPANVMDAEANLEYLEFARDALVGAVREATDRLQSASLRVATIDVPTITFNRRSMYRGDGVATNGPHWRDDFVGLEGPVDSSLQVLLAVAEDESPLGGLINFASHPILTAGRAAYSADFPGVLTQVLATKYGCVFGFLQGAAANLWPIDRSSMADGLDPYFNAIANPDSNTRRVGEALAAATVEALKSPHTLSSPRLRVESAWVDVPERTPTKEQVRLARWYLESEEAKSVDQREFSLKLYGHPYTFYPEMPAYEQSVQEWFAREAIGMWEWHRRAGLEPWVDQLEIQVIALGDFAFVGYPVELFTEFGLRVKQESPFGTTFVCELANGWFGYVPTQEAFAHGGYEPRLAFQSRLVPEAGDRLTDVAIGLLNRLHAGASV